MIKQVLEWQHSKEPFFSTFSFTVELLKCYNWTNIKTYFIINTQCYTFENDISHVHYFTCKKKRKYFFLLLFCMLFKESPLDPITSQAGSVFFVIQVIIHSENFWFALFWYLFLPPLGPCWRRRRFLHTVFLLHSDHVLFLWRRRGVEKRKKIRKRKLW